MGIEVYRPGVEQAKRLIAEGRVSNRKGDWHEINPGTEQQDEFIEENGLQAWALWHLAYRPEDDPDTKSAYAFPYGDYDTVCREGLLAAEERAKQYGYEEVQVVALELLSLIDEALED